MTVRKGSFLQQDVSRAIRAARVAGLSIASVIVEGARITITARDGEVLASEDNRKGKPHDDGAAALDQQLD
jgi:hypothetical protein